MALKIVDTCIACGACEPQCPNGAISFRQPIYVIDPLHCTECFGYYATQQCAAVCPVESCIKDERTHEGPEQLRRKFEALYPERELVNVAMWQAP
jgi:ferredoxin